MSKSNLTQRVILHNFGMRSCRSTGLDEAQQFLLFLGMIIVLASSIKMDANKESIS